MKLNKHIVINAILKEKSNKALTGFFEYLQTTDGEVSGTMLYDGYYTQRQTLGPDKKINKLIKHTEELQHTLDGTCLCSEGWISFNEMKKKEEYSVRVYINIEPEFIPALIEILNREEAHFKIPNFTTIKDISEQIGKKVAELDEEGYQKLGRADKCVVYLEQSNYEKVMQKLETFFTANKKAKILIDKTPRGTVQYTIAGQKGIGIATYTGREKKNIGSSYGSELCDIVARAYALIGPDKNLHTFKKKFEELASKRGKNPDMIFFDQDEEHDESSGYSSFVNHLSKKSMKEILDSFAT